jgi:hypothetical protein
VLNFQQFIRYFGDILLGIYVEVAGTPKMPSESAYEIWAESPNAFYDVLRILCTVVIAAIKSKDAWKQGNIIPLLEEFCERYVGKIYAKCHSLCHN